MFVLIVLNHTGAHKHTRYQHKDCSIKQRNLNKRFYNLLRQIECFSPCFSVYTKNATRVKPLGNQLLVTLTFLVVIERVPVMNKINITFRLEACFQCLRKVI